MKKINLMLLGAMTLVSFYACNGGGDKKTEEVKTETTKIDTSKKAEIIVRCTGIENLLISDESAQAMMVHFDTTYKKANTYLSNSVWIDAMLITSYANFFESNKGKGFDGVRFVNAATNNHSNSRILMVPTKPIPDTPTTHKSIWGKGIISLEANETPEYLDYETGADVAPGLIVKFNSIYRNTPGLPPYKNPLSESVWMSSCVFIYLRDQIKITENQIDGIRVHMGAYVKMMGTVPGQIDANQSTILLVPTTKDNHTPGVHNDRWDILRRKSSLKMDDALNHGELCPNKCD